MPRSCAQLSYVSISSLASSASPRFARNRASASAGSTLFQLNCVALNTSRLQRRADSASCSRPWAARIMPSDCWTSEMAVTSYSRTEAMARRSVHRPSEGLPSRARHGLASRTTRFDSTSRRWLGSAPALGPGTPRLRPVGAGTCGHPRGVGGHRPDTAHYVRAVERAVEACGSDYIGEQDRGDLALLGHARF